jgi:transposase
MARTGRRGRSAAAGRDWLAALELPAVSRALIEDCLALIDSFAPTIDRLDAEVHERAKTGARVKVLTVLPGVGEFTALMILAEIGEISRFGSARKLAAWAGLTPTVRGSDLSVRHGHISKQGSAWLRWILCEAAQTAKRHPDFAATYAAMARRRGKKVATTAVARKLLTRAFHLLREADEQARRSGKNAGKNSGSAKNKAAGTTANASTSTSTRTASGASGARRRRPTDRDGHQLRASSQNRMSRPSGRAR